MTFTPLGESNSYPLQFNEAKNFVGNNQLVKGSPFLKCVVSIWALPVRGEECKGLSGSGPSGIKNFQSRDFRDGILQNPGIPGFFGTGLA